MQNNHSRICASAQLGCSFVRQSQIHVTLIPHVPPSASNGLAHHAKSLEPMSTRHTGTTHSALSSPTQCQLQSARMNVQGCTPIANIIFHATLAATRHANLVASRFTFIGFILMSGNNNVCFKAILINVSQECRRTPLPSREDRGKGST